MRDTPTLNARFEDKVKHFPSHNHNTSQLIYLKEGDLKLQIGAAAYLAHAPAIIVIGRMEDHVITPISDTYKRFCVNISPLGENAEDADPLITLLSRRPEGFCHVLEANGFSFETEALFSEMVKEQLSDRPFADRRKELLFYELLILIYRRAPKMFSSLSQKSAETVWLIQRQLEDKYDEPLTLESLAAKYHLNESYLSHLFKETTGYSIYQYLLMCRLSAAKNLLSNSKTPITRIAYTVGFNDSSNFSRHFRERFGMTPNQFRKANR